MREGGQLNVDETLDETTVSMARQLSAQGPSPGKLILRMLHTQHDTLRDGNLDPFCGSSLKLKSRIEAECLERGAYEIATLVLY